LKITRLLLRRTLVQMKRYAANKKLMINSISGHWICG